MFGYYGSKANLAKYYPRPQHAELIEPFAGSARYALQHFDREVTLVDKYEVIVKIWQWLQLCSPADILRLPRRFKPGQKLDSFTFECEEARLLMGFLVHFAAFSPGNKVTPHYTTRRVNGVNFSLKRIADNLFKIKHWKIIKGDYRDLENRQATWFVDPPYQHGGHAYVHGNKHLDFAELANWCQNRGGKSSYVRITRPHGCRSYPFGSSVCGPGCTVRCSGRTRPQITIMYS